MPQSFWGCHFPKGGAVIPREFYSGVPNSAGCHILCDTGSQYDVRCNTTRRDAGSCVIITLNSPYPDASYQGTSVYRARPYAHCASARAVIII